MPARSRSAAGDLIVAPATPWGRSAVALVRLSGEGCAAALARVARAPGGLPPARRARLCQLVDDEGAFDEGLLTFFPGPNSYTGEDSAELSCHGNPLIVDRLVRALLAAGARLAHPGEFTRRAVRAGRMDLTRAEAVLQSIEATSPRGLAIARAGMQGEVAALIDALREEATTLAAELEAWLDFPGEGLELMDEARAVARLLALAARAGAAADSQRAGRALVDGASAALIGPVNAGKSSLFNALLGTERALVSEQPGTTRDTLEKRVMLGGVAVTLLDTAGRRGEAEGLEALGVAMGVRLAEEADLLLVVVPAHEPWRAREVLAASEGRPRLLVGNHSDRPGAVAAVDEGPLLPTCARTGEGVPALAEAIARALVGEAPAAAGLVIASQRQADLLRATARAAEAAAEALGAGAGPAVAAEELYAALARLDELSGRDTREAVLDALFARFCVGK